VAVVVLAVAAEDLAAVDADAFEVACCSCLGRFLAEDLVAAEGVDVVTPAPEPVAESLTSCLNCSTSAGEFCTAWTINATFTAFVDLRGGTTTGKFVDIPLSFKLVFLFPSFRTMTES